MTVVAIDSLDRARARQPRLLIADDEPVMRFALRAQLGKTFDVVGGAADADSAIELAERLQPDVALIDIQMPGGGGLRAAREISWRAPHTAIVALSSDESVPTVLAMLRAGARKYLHKGSTGEELGSVLQSAIDAHTTASGDRGDAPRSSVLIADDEALMRFVLRAQLDKAFEVVGGAADADGAIELAERLQPDAALIDIQMPGGGGLRAAREISWRAPHTAIVALSSDESVPTVLAMLCAGARRYLHKGTTGNELTSVLRSAIEAQGHPSPYDEALRSPSRVMIGWLASRG
jgi:DNA-binding NarL/FixJ family response regulator